MDKKIYVVTIDEEFEKARMPGAKDLKPRRKRQRPWPTKGIPFQRMLMRLRQKVEREK